jgi:hypothetical protein
LHYLLHSETGKATLAILQLGADCVRNAHVLRSPDYDLACVAPESFGIASVPKAVDALACDYENTTAMIFGAAPSFDEILALTGRSRTAGS